MGSINQPTNKQKTEQKQNKQKRRLFDLTQHNMRIFG